MSWQQPATPRLEEALAALRAALEVLTRERFPDEWAGIQRNVGNVLSSWGENRETGTPPEPARLEEALAAFRAALEVWTRERDPSGWALVQNDLGVALYNLGRQGKGMARLEEALAAFDAALTVYNARRMDPYIKMTRDNRVTTARLLYQRRQGDG
jgi:tetratricopeptide (TPR) repeat protein